MALPMNTAPIYKLTVPSTGKEVEFRPFLIKEEKALLIAQQSEDPGVMLSSIKEVIKSCVKQEIDVDSLATFDIEYIFVQLRSKSVGEIIDLTLQCDTCTDDKAVSVVNIDLTKLNVTKNEKHNSNIKLFDDVGVVMKYPTIDIIKELESAEENDYEKVFDVIAKCIDTVYNSDEVFHIKEQPKAETMEFLNNLTGEQFGKIREFFDTMPVLEHSIQYNCPVCNKEHNKTLRGLESFF